MDARRGGGEADGQGEEGIEASFFFKSVDDVVSLGDGGEGRWRGREQVEER